MSLNQDVLVGYLRSEFGRTAKIRVWLFIIQLLVAVPGAVAVVVVDVTTTYVLAVSGAFLLTIWWGLNFFYQRGRAAAQAARRAATLIGGLGRNISANEISSLRDKMTVSLETAKANAKGDYYATKLPHGSARLGEMIEESAFYSAELQKISANIMLLLIGLFALVFTLIAFSAFPFVEKGNVITILRIVLAIFVFVMSSDVIGAWALHRSATNSLNDIKSRLKVARIAGFPDTDVMLIMADYNSAIEAAPESVPYAYSCREESLNARWKQYQIDNNNSGADEQ